MNKGDALEQINQPVQPFKGLKHFDLCGLEK